MSVPYYGDFAEDDTVLIPFNTFSSDDPSASVTITNLADADIKVHKDGGTTEIATDGASVAIDFDSRTGAHLITIDTSAHSDYATGSEYAVLIEGTTIDGATITAWVGAFSIERAGGVLAIAKLIQTAVITNAAGADIAADIIAVKAETADILTDTGTTLDGKIDDILTDTAEIGAAGAGLSAVPWNASWDAEVQSECADALNAYDPPTKAELDTAVADVSVDEIQASALADLFNTDSGTTYGAAVGGSVVSEIADNAGGSALTTDAIAEAMFTFDATATYATADAGSVVKQIADNAGGSALTEAGIADAVWDEAQADHVGAGTFGVTASEIADILVDTAELQTDDIPTLIAALPTAVEIQAEIEENGASILDTLRDDLADGGRLDLLVDAIKAKTDNLPADPASETNVNANETKIDTMQGNVTDILADTNELQGDWTNTGRLDAILDLILADTAELQGNQGNWATVTGHATEAKQDIIDTNVDLILADTGELQTDDIPTLIAALPTAAEVKADIEDTDSILYQMQMALVNKISINETTDDAEMFTHAGASAGSVVDAFTSAAGFTVRKKMIPA